MPDDAKLGLLAGVAGVLLVAVVYHPKPAPAGPAPAPAAAVGGVAPPAAPPAAVGVPR